ncbi:efflux RND transporter periplasmic adaptor subunit [Sandarakinorhabdus sp. AAP62]|uniref:efflux RND transporter periplasmic adaptor subunit n=1 Tax=Sandarakinorhabdus sp. AAP62 TaxID=1248916 RepID=UPI00187C4D58|nr:efflux RND transporter periplasmic adaptor subunit [Sandarakinorhabdus sp. AAP62]
MATRAAGRAPGTGIPAIFFLSILLAACGEPAAPQAQPGPALPVRVVSVAPVSGVTALDVAGTVRLKRETPLAFNTPGRIAAILVREGDRVQAGQLLARLDTTALGANQASAAAEVVRAQADVRRAEDLFAKGWVTAPRVEQARATMAAAQARARAARFDITLASLRAPSGGIVLARPGEPGQIAQPGQAILTIGELNQGFVMRLPLADRDAARVRQGQPATVTIPALGNESMQGQVSEVGARGDDGTGTFRIEVKLPANARLASGQIGSARLVLGPAEPGAPLLVPATAVFSARADEGFVYVLEPETRRVRQRLVSLGTVGPQGVVVTGGLKPGEMVATTGIDRLREGQVIEVAPNSVPAGRQAGK